MARDRKRAKQRQQRRAHDRVGGVSDLQSLEPNVPGPLQHSGDLDEFDAALVAGAQPDLDSVDEVLDGEAALGDDAEDLADDDFEEPDQASRSAAAAAFGGGGDDGDTRPVAGGRAPTPRARRSLIFRAVSFLRASWAELQRVQWPDRRQVAQATAVVLGFVVVAGLYLGAADWVAQKVVNFVL